MALHTARAHCNYSFSRKLTIPGRGVGVSLPPQKLHLLPWSTEEQGSSLLRRVLPARSCPSFPGKGASALSSLPVCLTASLPLPNPSPEGDAQVALALSLMRQTPLRCWLCREEHGPWGETRPACSSFTGRASAQDTQSTALSHVTPPPPPAAPGQSSTDPYIGRQPSSRGHLLPGFQGQGTQQGKVETTRDHIRGGKLQKVK